MNKILSCNRCLLRKNQKPLIDNTTKGDVIWVGLSAKKVESIKEDTPLSINTNSGKLIKEIEDSSPNRRFYKTNLVKCPPLDKNKKLRYPNETEKNHCFDNLEDELKSVNPDVIFLLGANVAKFVLKKFNINFTKFKSSYKYESFTVENLRFIPIHHPSYIHIYKRKEKAKYIKRVTTLLNN